MGPAIQLLRTTPGLEAADAWVGFALFCVLTIHAIVRLLRAILVLRSEWKTRPR
jgi:hypothetical protein